MNNLLRFSERVKQSTWETILGKAADIEAVRVHPKVIKLTERASGAQLALKQSRLNRPILVEQLALVEAIRPRVPFVPMSFGSVQDRDGHFHAIWQWLGDSDVGGRTANIVQPITKVLRDFLCAAGEETVGAKTCFPNETLPSFLSALEDGTLRTLMGDPDTARSVRRVIGHAAEVANDADFRTSYSCLPSQLVHSDIRAANLLHGWLVDFSNARIDQRIIELSRYAILNVLDPNRFAIAVGDPESTCGERGELLTKPERILFPSALCLDFCCMYVWARRAVEKSDYRRNWAADFLARCPDQLEAFRP